MIRRCGSAVENRFSIVRYSPGSTRIGKPGNPLPGKRGEGQYLAVDYRTKIIPWDALQDWRRAVRETGRKLVVTNGCFDILHVGHVTYLQEARNLGDVLLVGLNSDASVRELKGAGRPVNAQEDRAAVLAALESVGGVCIFNDRSATGFLRVAQPDIYAKGGDYTLDALPRDECRTVEEAGGRIVIIPGVPGKSSTALLKRISRR